MDIGCVGELGHIRAGPRPISYDFHPLPAVVDGLYGRDLAHTRMLGPFIFVFAFRVLTFRRLAQLDERTTRV